MPIRSRGIFWSMLLAALCACQTRIVLPPELQQPIGFEQARNHATPCPLVEAADAAWVALRIERGASVYVSSGSQRVTNIARSTYQAAYDQIHGPDATAPRLQATDAPVWLVDLEGMWQVRPPVGNAAYTARRYRMRVAINATGDCAPTLSMRATELRADEGE